MPLPIAAIGLGVGLAGAIGKMFGRGKANRELRKLEKENPVYQRNPIADQRYGLARTLLNARMPGAVQQERNIYGAQAAQLANVNRNATDASQALAISASTQGATNQAFGDLGIREAQDYQRRYGNFEQAGQGVIAEGDKVFQDQVRRFQDKAQIRGAQQQNRQANWGDVSNLGFGLMDFGMSGGFDKMFGGGGNNSFQYARLSGDAAPQSGQFSGMNFQQGPSNPPVRGTGMFG